jgi:enoyl-CoA hydratase/carnithine racemase
VTAGVSVVRWERERAVRVIDMATVDEAAGPALVLEGVSATDDDRLSWCRHAPCVVIGWTPRGREPSAQVDVALVSEQDGAELDAILQTVTNRPQASRALVDVLRSLPALDVAAGVTLEAFAYSTLLAGAEFRDWLAGRVRRPARTFEGPPVRCDRRGSELHVTLVRPENRNAFSAAMRDALFEALTAAEADSSMTHVVLAGDGPVFSSGGDLGEFGTAVDPVIAREIRVRRSIGLVLSRLDAGVTVFVQGHCVGAGVELAAFADRVVADPASSFSLPEVGMGLIPGAGGTVSLSRRIGRQQTARLSLLGEPIEAAEALRLGLVDEIQGSNRPLPNDERRRS